MLCCLRSDRNADLNLFPSSLNSHIKCLPEAVSLQKLSVSAAMITGIAHVNLTVPPGTLDLAEEFYAGTLGFHSVPVPQLQKNSLAW